LNLVKNSCEIDRFLRQFDNKIVTIFGSARVPEESIFYQKSFELSTEFAKRGFHILTGGGAGVMEAGNRGAKNHDVKSIGLNVRLHFEQNLNPYVTDGFKFEDYSLRKETLMKHSKYFVVFGGGFGTLDEIGELLGKLQHGKLVEGVKIFFFDTSFYSPIQTLLKSMLNENMISNKDIENVFFVNSVDEVLQKI
jgi:uncharacterized protein (TIGR00730 family)